MSRKKATAVRKTAAKKKPVKKVTVPKRSRKARTATVPAKTVPKGKFCYFFGAGKAEGNAEMRDLEGRRLEEVQDSQAQINVVSEELYPLISCFFYMH